MHQRRGLIAFAGTVFMSGYPDDALLQRGLAHSAVWFLEKPLTPGKLIAKVREVLDRLPTK